MDIYFPSKDDLEQLITKAVRRTVEEALPSAIHKATRKKWLNTDEVMKMLQCSRRHVQYLRDSEQLPFVQNGRTIRYDIDDVEHFLNTHKVRSRQH
ncbi:helix-turn-helix domain-containing protein [Balneolales bacterium ANBcel1]|nr:helix-turn-helix domain-containing protein [Balneolales bacterium ANBcel1]